jgi:hypothetical protein
MCSSFKDTSCRSRSSLIALVTLASGSLAGVIPTTRIRHVSCTRAHVAFISIHEQAATFASMTHLLIFVTDPSIFGYAFEQARFPLFIDLDILRFDLLSDFQIRVSHLRLILWPHSFTRNRTRELDFPLIFFPRMRGPERRSPWLSCEFQPTGKD